MNKIKKILDIFNPRKLTRKERNFWKKYDKIKKLVREEKIAELRRHRP